MIRILALSLTTLIAVVAWKVSIFFANSEGLLKSPVLTSESSQAFAAAVKETVAAQHTGNFSMIIVEGSEIAERYFMSERVFAPHGMERTTFNHEAAIGLAQNFDLNGDTEPFRWYTALAATSLFTTV